MWYFLMCKDSPMRLDSSWADVFRGSWQRVRNIGQRQVRRDTFQFRKKGRC